MKDKNNEPHAMAKWAHLAWTPQAQEKFANACTKTLTDVKELEKNMNKEKIKSIVTSGDCVNAIVEQLANYFEEQSKLKTQALERADTDLKVLRAEFKGYKQGCADMYNSFE